MKAYSQITFDFTEANSPVPDSPAIGVRIKSLKNNQNSEPDQSPDEILEDQPVAIVEQETKPANPKKSSRGRKSLKTIAAEADLINVPSDEVLFQRQYYTIGEVSVMFRVNASLLRFWESEFDIIQPRKNRKGDRHFRPVDIKNIQLIYDLLRRRKLTIEGAKDFLKSNKKSQERFEMIQSLQRLRAFILELKASL